MLYNALTAQRNTQSKRAVLSLSAGQASAHDRIIKRAASLKVRPHTTAQRNDQWHVPHSGLDCTHGHNCLDGFAQRGNDGRQGALPIVVPHALVCCDQVGGWWSVMRPSCRRRPHQYGRHESCVDDRSRPAVSWEASSSSALYLGHKPMRAPTIQSVLHERMPSERYDRQTRLR